MNSLLSEYQTRVQQHLTHCFTQIASQTPPGLLQAMRYATLSGGKRLRPSLVYLTGVAFAAEPNFLDAPACAVELIHCFSLIHDDLPAMDNAALRHGQPSCHITFGEDTAILAGDALQTLAFEQLANAPDLTAEQKIQMINVLVQATGAQGMSGGQFLDLTLNQQTVTTEQLETMYRLKTGALIQASVLLGAIAAQHPPQSLAECAQCIGLAFQIQDDILDMTATTQELGKQAQHDQIIGKITWPQLNSLQAAQHKVAKLYQHAIELITHQPIQNKKLVELIQWMATREF